MELDVWGVQTVPTFALLVLSKLTEDTAATNRALMASYAREVAELRAELMLVRTQVCEALERPYMPSSRYLYECLIPDRQDIQAVAEQDPDYHLEQRPQDWVGQSG